MRTVVFTGSPEEATKLFMSAVANGQYGNQLRDQTWAGDRLIANFEDVEAWPERYVARIVLAGLAGLALAFAGWQMFSLHSVAGNTIVEAFDQYVGIACFGLALLSWAYAAGARR